MGRRESVSARIGASPEAVFGLIRVSALDPAAGCFAYRSQSDDNNPSYADWEWRVEPLITL